jgi:raffinose/stachyose/melibiose transport system permease protein
MFKREDFMTQSENWFVKNLFGQSVHAQKNRTFIFFLLPALVPFILFVIIPFINGVYFSLTDWTGLNTGSEEYIGFINYTGLLQDDNFMFSFYRTVLYSFMSVIVINVVAFGLALLVTQNIKIQNVARAGFFIPNLIGGLVLGYIWQFIYNRALIEWVNPSLIMEGETAIFGLVVVVTWQYAGYIMMIYIAALQNVPQDLVEAAKIDGANYWQQLRTIIFPLVAQAFTIAMFLTLVTSFKQFDTVVSLTQGGPSMQMPIWFSDMFGLQITSLKSTKLAAHNIYDTAFVDFEMGIGQAKAIIFFFVLFIISGLQVYFNQKREVEL